MLSFSILYEDRDLLVIDKPFGVVVNRAETVKEETVQDWAEKEFRIKNLELRIDKESDFLNRSGIVHRLDKETSGCLIIAKNPEAFVKLQKAFKERLIKKKYVALIHGKLVPPEGEIRAPVGRLPWNREQFGVIPGGKEAVTRYKRIMNYAMPAGRQELRIKNSKEILTFIELYPETGRTHQLRVHLKYLGFPIVGDYLYAGRKRQREDRQWCPRAFLHASEISFPHPKDGQAVTVTSPLPPELQKALEKLTSTS